MEKDKLGSIIESLLFVSGEPLALAKIAKICSCRKEEAEAALQAFEKSLEDGRGLKIVRKDDNIQLVTDPLNNEYVSNLVSSESNADLSRSALETLSIIAYKGPVTRTQIEAIRGVNCTYTLRNLLIRGLIERQDLKNIRGFSYRISLDFLKHLGLEKVQDLPSWQELSNDDKVNQVMAESETSLEADEP